MKYLGGKTKIAAEIRDIILTTTPHRGRLIEPFMGAGSMTAALSHHFALTKASDTHEDLIMMWTSLQNGWEPPTEVSEQEYKDLKKAPPSPLRGFVGFGCSWGGKWFGGYARGKTNLGTPRNFADEASRSVLKRIGSIKNTQFSIANYKTLSPMADDVVYADPPYTGTTGYRDHFDHQEFWATMTIWSRRGATVFVSEYTAPESIPCIWQTTRTRDMKSKFTNAEQVTENLFLLRRDQDPKL
jgi:DNA adenine methylase